MDILNCRLAARQTVIKRYLVLSVTDILFQRTSVNTRSHITPRVFQERTDTLYMGMFLK